MRAATIFAWGLLGASLSASGEVSLDIGINVGGYPDLVAVPDYPVYYAPQLDSNLFFYDGLYWVFAGDRWYSSSWYNGPWGIIERDDVPMFVLRIPVRYYRRPPAYFAGWGPDAPPRWGMHWGRGWERNTVAGTTGIERLRHGLRHCLSTSATTRAIDNRGQISNGRFATTTTNTRRAIPAAPSTARRRTLARYPIRVPRGAVCRTAPPLALTRGVRPTGRLLTTPPSAMDRTPHRPRANQVPGRSAPNAVALRRRRNPRISVLPEPPRHDPFRRGPPRKWRAGLRRPPHRHGPQSRLPNRAGASPSSAAPSASRHHLVPASRPTGPTGAMSDRMMRGGGRIVALAAQTHRRTASDRCAEHRLASRPAAALDARRLSIGTGVRSRPRTAETGRLRYAPMDSLTSARATHADGPHRAGRRDEIIGTRSERASRAERQRRSARRQSMTMKSGNVPAATGLPASGVNTPVTASRVNSEMFAETSLFT